MECGKSNNNKTYPNGFVIRYKLCSLNEYINACRINKYQGAKFKNEIEEVIGWEIKRALAKSTLKPTDKPCIVHFVWYEKTAKRDCDNIASAKKFILDAMQKHGIIKNDNQRYIKGFTDKFEKAPENRVNVFLEECE